MSKSCYAATLGDCDTKLTGEHYISRSVLEVIAGDGLVYVEGLQKLPNGLYGQNALVSNILCKSHNEALSDLDAEAALVITALRDYQTALDAGRPRPTSRSVKFSGDRFELWLLKVVFGLMVATQLGSKADQTTLSALRSQVLLLRVLFGQATWPLGWGFYMNSGIRSSFKAPETSDGRPAEFGVEPLSADGEIGAANFWVRSLPFALTFGKPDHIGSDLYRPSILVLRPISGSAKLRLRFAWRDAREVDHPVVNILREAPSPE